MKNPLLEDLDTSLSGISVTLPSGGLFYDSDTWASDSAETVVYAVPYYHEIMLTDPSLILSGEAIQKLVRKACPDVGDAMNMMDIDVKAILIASRIAGHGENLELDVICPECEHQEKVNINLMTYLMSLSPVTKDALEEFRVVLPSTGMTVDLQPVRYRDAVDTAMVLSMIMLNEDIPKELSREWIEKYGAQIQKVIAVRSDTVKASIRKVTTRNGVEVDDPGLIDEWFDNLPAGDARVIENRAASLVEKYFTPPKLDFKCSSCGKTFSHAPELDPMRLFSFEEPTQEEDRSGSSKKSRGGGRKGTRSSRVLRN